MASESAKNRLLTVALLSASASAALTYAVLRLRSQRERTSARHSDHSSCCGSAPVKRDPYDASPRTGYLSWDDYFMAVAFLSAQRSKDPNKQVGACIVDQNQVICGIGYNGFPRGCPDSNLPWAKKSRSNDPLQTKYPYVCHAEMNAILNKNGASVAGAKIYVTLFPCNECAKLLIQAGIREIIYHEDKLAPRRPPSPSKDGFRPDQQYAASKKLLALAGVSLRQHRFRHPVTLRLTNHPAFPMVRSVDSAAVAAEAAAAAAAAASAQRWQQQQQQQEQQQCNGGSSNGALGRVTHAAAEAGGPSNGDSTAPALTAAAARAPVGAFAGQPLLPLDWCPPQLLMALAQYRAWQLGGGSWGVAAAPPAAEHEAATALGPAAVTEMLESLAKVLAASSQQGQGQPPSNVQGQLASSAASSPAQRPPLLLQRPLGGGTASSEASSPAQAAGAAPEDVPSPSRPQLQQAPLDGALEFAAKSPARAVAVGTAPTDASPPANLRFDGSLAFSGDSIPVRPAAVAAAATEGKEELGDAEGSGEDDGSWAVGGSGVWEPASDASIGLA